MPNSLTLYNADNGIPQDTTATITSPLTGTVTFDWNIASGTGYEISYDPLYFIYNGQNIVICDLNNAYEANGTFTYNINAGDTFGFNASSPDGIDGYKINTFSNFTFQNILPACFNEGTKILCLNKNFEEEYVPIENLRKGDIVKSFKHGYRKIDLIGKRTMMNNPNKCKECMYKMEKTEMNGLIEDLIVTGGHSILVDNLGNYEEENKKLLEGIQQIDNKYLLLAAVSNEFVKLENTNLYTYYHFTLENNNNTDERFGVWANGILAEITSEKLFFEHKYILIE